jgi:hypothetical protein
MFHLFIFVQGKKYLKGIMELDYEGMIDDLQNQQTHERNQNDAVPTKQYPRNYGQKLLDLIRKTRGCGRVLRMAWHLKPTSRTLRSVLVA